MTVGDRNRSVASVYLSKWPEKSDTRTTMRQALDRVAKVFDEETDAESFAWEDLRYEDARSIAASLADEDLAPATINKCLSAVRGVLATAWRLGAMPDEVYRKIEIDNVAGNSELAGRALSEKEMDALHAALAEADPRDAAMIAIMAGAGVRKVELVRLCGSDYRRSSGRLSVEGKRNKKREIPVGKRWQSAIERWIDQLPAPSAPMFEFDVKNERRAVSYVVEKFCQQNNLKTFTPHDLRRTFGTRVEEKAGIAVAQKLLGHESPRTTSLYVRVDESREAEAVEDL